MNRATWSGVFFAVVLLAMPAAPRADDATEEVAEALGKAIVEKVTNYAASRKDRALAACIDWRAPIEKMLKQVFWTYTSAGSDIPIFHGRLMQSSIASCEQWRPSEDHCACVEVAMDDRIVLELSETEASRFSTASLHRPKSFEPTENRTTNGTVLFGRKALRDIEFSLKQPAYRKPVNGFSEVSLDELGFYLVVNWGTFLEERKTYRVDYRSVDESGQEVLTAYQFLTPETRSTRSWQWFTLRQEFDEPGLWTYEVMLEGRKVGERQLRILPAN